MIRDPRSSPTTQPVYTGGYNAPQSPYLRRASPPGSPAPRKCCLFEQQQHQNQQQQHNSKKETGQVSATGNGGASREMFFCCCYTCPGDNTTSILATLGVCCLVVGYTVLGAFIFMTLEGKNHHDTSVAASKTNPKSERTAVDDLRQETVEKLWSITENLNILYRENWTKLAAEEVLVFQKSLFDSLKKVPDGENGQHSKSYNVYYSQHQNQQNQVYHKWSFSSSFLYSLTLITTIGYGSVSPRTNWGKIVTIIYALVGIPLMLLYLSATGDLLARSFRRLYGKMCGFGTAAAGGSGGTGQKQQQAAPVASSSPCPCTNPVRVPVTLCLIIILAYICSGAVLFHRLENWSFLEGSYFCFTSLGTIGFGNLLPGQNTEEMSLCICSAYILTGMALVAMCFNLVQEEVINLLRYIGATCSRNKSNLKMLKDEELGSILGVGGQSS